MRGTIPISVEQGERGLTRWDALAVLLTLGLLVFVAEASRHLLQPLVELQLAPLSLAPENLPEYAARTTLRMLVALVLSLLFTFTYATLAAKSRRAESLAGAAARHPAIGADPRLHLGDRRVLHVAGARPRAGCGIRGDLRDFHQPGLEHGFQLLSVAAHGAGRAARGVARVPAFSRGCASGGWKCRSRCRSSSGT